MTKIRKIIFSKGIVGLSLNNTLFNGKFGFYTGIGGIQKTGGDLYDINIRGEISLGESNSDKYVNSTPFTYVDVLPPYDRWHFIIDE